MFYLKHFFKVLIKSPLRGGFLVLFSILLVFSLGQRKFLEEQFLKLIPESKAGSYFYALVSSSESYQTIISQMGVLPGVHKIELLSEAEIKEEVKNVLGNLNISEQVIDLNYVGLKVIYTKDLKPRAQELVRDYLTHLSGEGNITLGAIRTESQVETKKDQLIATIKAWGYSIYLVFISILWSISLFSIRAKISETSYLLENYQRKKNIALKMAILGLGLIFVLSAASTLAVGFPQLLNLGLSFILFILGMISHKKKFQWDN